MILSVQNITKAFGTDVIVSAASFHIQEHEKAAIVGINGAGKTTILRMIAGELHPDEGVISISKGKTLGYLTQHQDVNSTASIYEELLSVKRDLLDMEQELRRMEAQMKQLAWQEPSQDDALTASDRELSQSEYTLLMERYNRVSTEFENRNGYAAKSEIIGVLKGLGFSEEEFDKQICTLSGGQKTRVALGKLLLMKPDILLLDEPTNHLDLNSIAWLENYLINYDSAVLIVAHDRYFLNRVVTKIIELDNGRVRTFDGDYTAYAQKKAQLRETEWKAYLNQQQEIRHQEEVIRKLKSFNREKSIKRAESRIKMLDKMDVLEKPSEVRADMHLHFSPQTMSGNEVLKVEHLSKAYPSNPLFSDLDFLIRRGERVALIGDNGTGKTTILKIVNGLEQADAGRLTIGSRVQIGYYDQEHQQLHMDKTLFDEISDVYPDMTETGIRSVLASFLFTGDDVYKRVGELSGGERGRLALVRLMLSKANFLILDEPTNHLDITSKEILEEALSNYTGTVFYVSHDRYFINQTATRILELKNRTLTQYIGNYDYYLEKTEELLQSGRAASISGMEQPQSSAKEDRARRKEEQAQKRRLLNELKRTEERIAALEERDRELDALLSQENVFTDVEQCTRLTQEKAVLVEELEQLYEKWEELSEQEARNQSDGT